MSTVKNAKKIFMFTLVMGVACILSIGGCGNESFDRWDARISGLHPDESDSLDIDAPDEGGATGLEQKTEDLARIAREIETEYRNLTAQLSKIQLGHRERQAYIEYENYMKGLMQVSRIQIPISGIYMHKEGNESLPQPFPPQPIIIGPFSVQGSNPNGLQLDTQTNETIKNKIIDVRESILQFMTALNSTMSGKTGDALAALRKDVETRSPDGQNVEWVSSTVTKLNKIISDMRELKQQHNSLDVWIDTTDVSDHKERKRIKKLFFEERKKKHHVRGSKHADETSSVNSDVPSIYSLTIHRHSHHNRLRIFRDLKNSRIKIVGICGSSKHPFMYAFECDSTSRSMTLLGEARRRNRLSDAVMKVTCYSRDFARFLTTDATARPDRCLLSKWPELAGQAGITEPKLPFNDRRRAKRAFSMLITGEGCFSRNERDIEIDCLRKRH